MSRAAAKAKYRAIRVPERCLTWPTPAGGSIKPHLARRMGGGKSDTHQRLVPKMMGFAKGSARPTRCYVLGREASTILNKRCACRSHPTAAESAAARGAHHCPRSPADYRCP